MEKTLVTNSVVKMVRNVSTKIELAKTAIELTICLNQIKLSDTEVTVLAYFMVYGISQQTKALIVKAGVCKNINNIKTVMVKLKKKELIYKDEFSGKVLVAKSLSFDITPTVVMYFKIDNKV